MQPLWVRVKGMPVAILCRVLPETEPRFRPLSYLPVHIFWYDLAVRCSILIGRLSPSFRARETIRPCGFSVCSKRNAQGRMFRILNRPSFYRPHFLWRNTLRSSQSNILSNSLKIIFKFRTDVQLARSYCNESTVTPWYRYDGRMAIKRSSRGISVRNAFRHR